VTGSAEGGSFGLGAPQRIDTSGPNDGLGKVFQEQLSNLVERGASNALAHVELWPIVLDLSPGLEGRILCSLTWVSDLEYDQFTRKAV